MIRSSIIPTRRRRWPHPLLLLAAACIVAMSASAILYDPAALRDAERQTAALHGYDQGYADAMNQVADSIGAAYATGYRAAQRDVGVGCPASQGAPL